MIVLTISFSYCCITPLRVFHIVKLYFCFAIFVTYALVFYVPMDFIEPQLFKALEINKLKWRQQIFQLIFRTVIVIITGMPHCDILLCHLLLYV